MWQPGKHEKKLSDLFRIIDRDWQAPGPLRLMFQDEARFGRISDTRRCWRPKPIRPLCHAIVAQEYTYAYAAVAVAAGGLDSLVLPHVNGACMQLFLEAVMAPRHPNDRIVMVLDGAGWHQSRAFTLPDDLRLPHLLPYSPALNPVGYLGDELREKSFHNRAFSGLDALENRLETTLRKMELDPQRAYSITAWPWILIALTY